MMHIFRTGQFAINVLPAAGVLEMSKTRAPQTPSRCLFHGAKITAPASLVTLEMGL
jgi:hypothetical protein